MKEALSFTVCALAVCLVWMGVELRKMNYQIESLNRQIYQFQEIL